MIGMIIRSLGSGMDSLLDYIVNHTITCLIPALFIAGAIAAFVKKDAILKYFGPSVKRYISYPLAAVSGTVLAVCSCTILPLFAGIYKKGSGIGPATAFLYSGPAINVLAIAYTASALGYDIGAARAIIAVLMSMVIGFLMSVIYRKHDRALMEEAKKNPMLEMASEKSERPKWVPLAFFLSLLGILIFGASSFSNVMEFASSIGLDISSPWMIKFPIVYALTIGIGLMSIYYFKKDEITDWGMETWDLTKKIVPILVAGAFVVGVIAYFVPPETFRPALGNEGILANLLASVIGALLYMPTLLEVPIIGTTFGYSDGVMGSGPALALLLAGPAVSLPSMIVLTKIMGLKKTMTYILLVVIFSSLAGFIYGNLIV
ncbi:MAG: permease [Candidatus Thermoplasmatota archaeon]|nr:permease [Candidatus Thermoplasmatota archaeon]